MRLAQPELDHGSWCWTIPAALDARLIGASHTSQGGRITNVYVPTERVGCLLTCRSRIHEEMVWGAIGIKRTLRSNPRKNRNQSTQQRCHQTTHEPGRSQPNLRSGSTEGPAPPPLPSHRPSRTRGEGPMRRRRRRGSPQPFDDRKIAGSPVTGRGARGRRRKPGKNLLDCSASFRDGPTSATLESHEVAEVDVTDATLEWAEVQEVSSACEHL